MSSRELALFHLGSDICIWKRLASPGELQGRKYFISHIESKCDLPSLGSGTPVSLPQNRG